MALTLSSSNKQKAGENNLPVTVIYLHGFQSSSRSAKAVIFKKYLAAVKSGWQFVSPDLPFSPDLTKNIISKLIAKLRGEGRRVCLMGSSMGGFYASYFSQSDNVSAVLINPVVEPFTLFDRLLNTEQENIYTGERHCFCQIDLDKLLQLNRVLLSKPENIYLLAEAGDEVLDYRLAEKKYNMCRKNIIEGGNHRFQHFEAYLPAITAFFESAASI